MGRPAPTFDEYRERFWTRVDQAGDCWIWQGSTGHWGYGHFRAKSLRVQMGYREQLAHRWAWIFTHGPIPKGMVIRHACDNPPCVNPDHLLIGTHRENAADRQTRRRHWARSGEAHGMARLTEDQVREIRALYVAGSRDFGTAALARRYGVSQMNISLITRRVTWTHI